MKSRQELVGENIQTRSANFLHLQLKKDDTENVGRKYEKNTYNPKPKTSKYIGVTRRSNAKKGKTKSLGYFSDEEEAVRALDKVATNIGRKRINFPENFTSKNV